MPLDPNIAGLLQFIVNAGYPPMSEGTVEQARVGLRALTVDFRDPAALAPAEVTPATVAGAIPVRVYRPRSASDAPPIENPLPTIVYFHGGGFVIGDLDTHESVCCLLAQDVAAVVVSVDYRLAPEHVFPAAVDDCWAALQDIDGHIADYGGDAGRLVVGGDSAGGNLAAICAQRARDAGLPLAAQLLVYPAVDLLGEYPSRQENAEGYFLTLADMHWFAAHYLGVEGVEGDAQAAAAEPRAQELARDPRISPLHAESLAGLAPAVVATAEFDPLRDEGDAYAKALDAAGVKVEHRQFPGLIHGFYGLEFVSPAIADATKWINAALRDLIG